MSDAVLARNSVSAYEEDVVLWAREQARLLRERRFDELDLDHLVDEVEGVGKSERREIRNRMAVLVAHLLKWKYQPGRRSPSWQTTIRDQRSKLLGVIEDSPSLNSYPAEHFDETYRSGRLKAAAETGIDFTLFPEQPPFTVEQVLDDGFLPKEPDLYDQS